MTFIFFFTDEICTVFSIEGEATTKIGVALETNSKLVITKQKYNGIDDTILIFYMKILLIY